MRKLVRRFDLEREPTGQHLSTPYVLKKLAPFALPHWFPILMTFVLTAGETGLALFKPWPMKFIFDSVLTKPALDGRTLYLLIGIAGLVVLVAFLDGLISYKQASYINLAGRTVVFDLRAALFDHIHRVSLQFHSNRQTGDLMTRVTSDVKSMQDVLTQSLIDIVASVLYLAGMAVLLLILDWQLAVIAIVASIPMYVLLIRYTRQVRELSRAERAREGALASVLYESLGAIRLTRVFNQEEHARERFREESHASLESGFQATMAGARFGWAVAVVQAAITALILAFGVQRVMAGAMSFGSLIIYYSYIRNFYRPLRTTMGQYTKITGAMARAERVVDLLEQEAGVSDLPDASRAPAFEGEVELRNVTFAYEQGRPVLKRIRLELPAHQVTAIVGPTGVGKTTLASLIPRLYDPTAGAVLIDGVDIRKYTLKSVRAQISMVLQESVLFRASVQENIAYGRPSATQDEIVDAAKAANAHQFITALPEGYETIVGERGETLSGGQRQRIAIARAMIRDAPILILDEPLVGLDVDTQGVVLEAFERLMAGRTVLLITHQLSTVLRADNIVVMEDGKIVEQGSVNELMDANGSFSRLLGAEGGILAGRR